MSLRCVLAMLGALASSLTLTLAQAQPLALPPRSAVQLEQRLGERVPLDLDALDEAGRRTRLRDFFGDGRAVLLVPGYYRCPQLCGLVMHDLLQALQQGGMARDRWRIVAFSIDPAESVADARARREADLALAASLAPAVDGRRPPDLHLLVLAPADTQRLARAIGYGFEAQAQAEPQARIVSSSRYAHPASVAVLTPRGTVSRYFNGLDFDPGELRMALADAQGDRIGAVTARLALLCAHFDPGIGRLSAPVMEAMRGVSLLVLVALGAWIVRHARGGRR